ncbi:MAG: IS4 family transposase, partial [Opitutaceae bacterium]
GCRIEERQLESAARLKRALMVDLVVAWRIMSLGKAARETPQAPASAWLSEEEWRALTCYFSAQRTPATEPPGVRQAVRWIAQLGGFLGRARDGEPGPIVLWRGLQQLRAITAAWTRFGPQKCG